MSVRATNSIIGEAVIVSVLPKSPQMVVKTVDEGAKLITASWFSDTNEYQEGTFAASALDRAEAKKASTAAKTTKSRK
jgi:hypothetical protein